MATTAAIRREFADGKVEYAGWLAAAALLAVAPLFLSTYWVRALVLANVFALFALSWDVISGHTNYISLGHSFLIGVGGYTTAIASTSFGLPLYASMGLGILGAMVAGVVFFVPSLRLRGIYFTFVTLILPVVSERLVIAGSRYTGGERGISGVPTLLPGLLPDYYLSLALVLVIAFLFWQLTRSDIGTVLGMIYESEDLVSNSGLNPTKFKLFVFMLSAFVAGLAGVYKVHHMGVATIDSILYLPLAINIVIAVMIGGRGSTTGAVGGAYLFVLFNTFTRPYLETSVRFTIFYVIGILFISLYPSGIFPHLWAVLTGRRGANGPRGDTH